MSLTGYGPDSDKNIAEAQAIMQKLGYNDANPLQIKIQTRNLPTYRDPAVILTDQLKKIHIVGELDILDTPRWYARLAKKDYTIGLNVTGVSVDDPDGNIVENYSCRSERNYTHTAMPRWTGCWRRNRANRTRRKRKKIVWAIERLLVDDAARPIILSGVAGNCWQPYVKNFHAARKQPYKQFALRGRLAGTSSFDRHCEERLVRRSSTSEGGSDEAIQSLACGRIYGFASRSLSSGRAFARPVGSQ